jgi:Domain of unknown function (DUF6429)
MHYEEEKIDEAVLAVLYLTAWEEHGLIRAWKGIDWNASNRLHERDLIDDTRNKNKSVAFTDEGPRSRANFRRKAILLGVAKMMARCRLGLTTTLLAQPQRYAA